VNPDPEKVNPGKKKLTKYYCLLYVFTPVCYWNFNIHCARIFPNLARYFFFNLSGSNADLGNFIFFPTLKWLLVSSALAPHPPDD
jgi:hypothetical protein